MILEPSWNEADDTPTFCDSKEEDGASARKAAQEALLNSLREEMFRLLKSDDATDRNLLGALADTAYFQVLENHFEQLESASEPTGQRWILNENYRDTLDALPREPAFITPYAHIYCIAIDYLCAAPIEGVDIDDIVQKATDDWCEHYGIDTHHKPHITNEMMGYLKDVLDSFEQRNYVTHSSK